MGEPAITLQAYHVSSGSNAPIHRIVIHATAPGLHQTDASNDGKARETAHYFQSHTSGGSAHYIEDGHDEEHCVHDNAIAWHAPPNSGSIGIEICGEAHYSAAQWNTAVVKGCLDRAAARCAELCHRFGIPEVKLSAHDLLAGHRGVCGHVDVSQAWHMSDHTDPGPNFPWGYFMDKVKGHSNPPPAPAPKPVVPGHQTSPRFPGRILVLGMHGNDVLEYQHQMLHRGWKAIGTADGQYGPKCVMVTKSFQHEKHLTVDGKVGRNTWNAAFTASIT
jgi:N-acetyl-anhydromuramyl-L-alanine amidase AmpD